MEVNSITIEMPSITKIWHKKFDHFNNDSLRQMVATHAVHGFSNLPTFDIPYVSYFWGKQARIQIPKQATSRASAPLELINSHLCGTICTPSLGDARHFINFIDDY